MATTIENEYGLREVAAGDLHGELDVWLERITEVVNLMLAVWSRDFEMLVRWDGQERLILTAGKRDNGKAILAILGEGVDIALPKSFTELVDIVSFALMSNFDLDEDLWGVDNLLEMAQRLRSP